MSRLVTTEEIAKALGRSGGDIMAMVEKHEIPNNKTPEGTYLFPLEEVLSKIPPLEVTAPVDPGPVPEEPAPVPEEPTDKPSGKKPVTSPKNKGKKRG